MTTDFDFEAKLRELLAEDAEGLRPKEAPYAAILHEGRVVQRRRATAVGVGLLTLVAVPGAALAIGDGWHREAAPASSGAPSPRSSTAADPVGPSPTVTSAPAEVPEPPSSPGQLTDGITLAQATASLGRCLGQYEEWGGTGITTGYDLSGYRLLYAWTADANANEGGKGTAVLAVSTSDNSTSDNSRAVYCRDRQDTHNMRELGGDGSPERLVMVDANTSVLYRQITLSGGPWQLPYRWADFGTVDPAVTRVTVSYGGDTKEAILDGGYFVTSGTLREATGDAPVVKGYGADGRTLYDSTKDQYYEQSVL